MIICGIQNGAFLITMGLILNTQVLQKAEKSNQAQMMPYFFYSDLGISIAIKIVSDVLKMDFAGFNEQIK